MYEDIHVWKYAIVSISKTNMGKYLISPWTQANESCPA